MLDPAARGGGAGLAGIARAPARRHWCAGREGMPGMSDVTDIDDSEVVGEVRAAFERYDRALAENDVAVLDDSFWEDGRTLRYGVGENLRGHAAIAAFRSARTLEELEARERRLENTAITSFGRDFAVANTEYVLLRDGRRGRQSQTWVRMPQGWRVVAAHVSLMA